MSPTEEYHRRSLTFIGLVCLNLLSDWMQQHQQLGGQLVLDGDSLAARSTAGKTPPRC